MGLFSKESAWFSVALFWAIPAIFSLFLSTIFRGVRIHMDKVLVEKPVGADGSFSLAVKALEALASFKYKMGWIKLDVGAAVDVEAALLWLQTKIPGKLDDAAIGIVLEFLKKDEPAKPAV